ncbi:ABC transporter substrate-binding protein [Botrimarina colliarenosi]|uniref:ABC transporter substrate-binding protein n=1 Tax=Botrimarina colliarenosi TaxID=2528001 RepID=UPI0018D4AE92|nr:ABC transporter substrate-binding protein [Botrimarina colliarenosi]
MPLLLALAPLVASGAEKVTLALNWKAQPELGGFYQALAAGHYAQRGLDVSIRVGGPMVNNRPLLPVGQAEFLIGTNLIPAFDVVKQGIPTRVVAAYFQRDPQCLISHADGPVKTWDDLRQAPLLLGAPGRHSFFLWLETSQGFQRSLIRPYNHNLAPFLVHKDWAVQGYATAEPRRILEASGKEPNVFLLADHGWASYSTLLETRQDLIDKRPELVQAFVDASTIGWYEYLYGDAAEANRLILADNRDMTQGQIDYSIAMMRKWGLVDSGAALTGGVGALDSERVTAFFDAMTAAGLFKPGELDPTKASDSRFVNRGVGLERRAELLPASQDN